MDTWLAAQEEGASKTKTISKHEKFFIFRNALRCGVCGSLLSGEDKQSGRYTYYRCWQAANGQCNEKYISEKDLIETVTGYIKRLQFPADYKSRMLADLEKMDRLKTNTTTDEKAKIDKRLSQLQQALKKAYWDKTQGIITAELFQGVQEDYQEQVDILNAKRCQVDRSEVTYYDLAWEYFELPEMMMETWISGSTEEKGALVKLLTSKITVKTKKAAVELNAPFSHLFKDMISHENEKWYPQGNSNLINQHS